MRKLILCLAAVFGVAAFAGLAQAAPLGALGAARADTASPLIAQAGHRHRHARRFHAPYYGIYVAPRRYYYPYYAYRYRYVPAYDYYYAPPSRYYYGHKRRHHDDDDWDDDDWDD